MLYYYYVQCTKNHYFNGATENAGVENAARAKMQGWKMQEWKMREQVAGVENAVVGSRGGKCRSSLAVDGQLNLECKERALSYFMENV